MDVSQFLAYCGVDVDKYLPVFTKEQITLNPLVELTEDRLETMGLPLGPRAKILSVLKTFFVFCFLFH